MIYLWVITGGLIGWVFVEIIAAITKIPWPVLLNYMCAFVGGFLAYNWAIGIF